MYNRLRMSRILLAQTLSLASFLLLLVAPSVAQRLPRSVKPTHYSLVLTPDLKLATFTGVDTIDVVIHEPVSAITVNAIEIKFLKVTTEIGGKKLTAKVMEDPEKQQATLNFGQRLMPGQLSIRIEYNGLLNNELRGFYLSKSATRNYAVTQFESTDARRAFPSFDEPAFKATFDISLIVDKGDTAISNTNIVKDEPAPGEGKHRITFAKTPKMSTYLVAFLVGDFQCVSGASDGVPIRACATPDQVQYGKYALSAAEYVLHYYDTYFGIKYPMPKLDMIAIPDFEAGAMENFGAITYRESDFLVDPDHASVDALKRVAAVVAHEMAHQWFGDLVTMQWWDNTWLNEGFATWMESKPVAAWKPEWKVPEDTARDNQDTLDLDAHRVTRTIRAKAETPDEIDEMFDGITYGKAGAVLLMVEHYLGEETFRRGVHAYLAAHMYGNATAEDFWSAQTAVSHKPVDKIMDSFVSQPGEPILTFGPVTDSRVPVSQQRFSLNGKTAASDKESWTLPVCFKSAVADKCDVLAAAKSTLELPAGSLLFGNADGVGYYRSAYTEGITRELIGHVESQLSPEERISFLGDQWALTRAGKVSVAQYLDLAGAVGADSSMNTVRMAGPGLEYISDHIASTPEERAKLASFVRAHFAANYRDLGAPRADDSPGKRELRAELLEVLASAGEDPEAIANAKAIAAKSLAEQGSVDPTLEEAALHIAARHGDAVFFDQLQKLSDSATNPQVKASALHALALFEDPALVQRALELAVSGEVRNQDAASLLGVELENRETQELAWTYMQHNWDKVMAQVTTDSGSSLVGATGGFCSADKIEQISSFFAAHKVPASARALARAKDEIGDCVDLREAQEANFKAWLAKQP